MVELLYIYLLSDPRNKRDLCLYVQWIKSVTENSFDFFYQINEWMLGSDKKKNESKRKANQEKRKKKGVKRQEKGNQIGSLQINLEAEHEWKSKYLWSD